MTDIPEPIDAAWIARKFTESSRRAAAEYVGDNVDPRDVAARTTDYFYKAIAPKLGHAVSSQLSRLTGRRVGVDGIALIMTPELRALIDIATEDAAAATPQPARRLRAIDGGASAAPATPPRAKLRIVPKGDVTYRVDGDLEALGLPAPTQAALDAVYELATSLKISVSEPLRGPLVDAAIEAVFLADRHAPDAVPAGKTYREMLDRAEQRRFQVRRARAWAEGRLLTEEDREVLLRIDEPPLRVFYWEQDRKLMLVAADRATRTLLQARYPKVGELFAAVLRRMKEFNPKWLGHREPHERPPPAGSLDWPLLLGEMTSAVRDEYPDVRLDWARAAGR